MTQRRQEFEGESVPPKDGEDFNVLRHMRHFDKLPPRQKGTSNYYVGKHFPMMGIKFSEDSEMLVIGDK